jgi:adenylate cyclase
MMGEQQAAQAAANAIDFEAEGLLDGLEGEQRTERLALLSHLSSEGVPLAELRRHTADGTIMFLPAERVIGGRERYTATEVVQRSGADLGFLLAARRAMGLPIPEEDEAAYIQADIDALQMAHVAHAAGISEEEILGLMRTLGRGLSFADLVGFTRLGEELSPAEISRLAVRLEAMATDIVEPPVRLVKTIGDAAMLTSLEPEPLLDAALALLDAADAEGEQFPQLRAGVALGPALSHAGDWFGRPVNLASRITTIARPGSVLAERQVNEATRERYRWSYVGERRLHGIRGPVGLFRARRLQEA